MTPQPGQITRIVEVATPDGSWRAAAEVYTDKGPVLGYLFATTNGTDGGVVFRPAPELQQLAGEDALAPEEVRQDAAEHMLSAGQPGGTLTTASVPTAGSGVRSPAEGAADPNDPRGLRPGRST